MPFDSDRQKSRTNDLDAPRSRVSIAPGKQAATSKLPAARAQRSSAPATVQRKAANTGADWTNTVFRPDLHGAPVQLSSDKGITGGKITHGDFLGDAATDEEREDVAADQARDDAMTLADHAASIATGAARSERDMLIAIESGNLPRFIARVGPQKNFAYGTFANPSRPFVFATEPADLRGRKPAEAMFKVGWTKEWIQPSIGQEIVVCVFDTHKAVPARDGSGADATVAQGKMEWPELTAKALADPAFRDAAEARGIDPADLPALLAICASTPVKGEPRTDDATQKRSCLIVRELIDSLYGANELYTGMGATLQQDGQLGGREVMVMENGTGLKLTPDNHVLVSLGTMTQADYDALP